MWKHWWATGRFCHLGALLCIITKSRSVSLNSVHCSAVKHTLSFTVTEQKHYQQEHGLLYICIIKNMPIYTRINVSVWPRGYLCLWYVTLGETKRPPVNILQPNNSVCVCGFLHLCPIDRFWSLSDNTTVFYWRNQMSPVLICHPPTN